MPIRATLMLLALAGCAEFPDLDAAISPSARAARYPVIAPLEEVLAEPDEPRATEETIDALSGRAAALRARAAQLRKTPIE